MRVIAHPQRKNKLINKKNLGLLTLNAYTACSIRPGNGPPSVQPCLWAAPAGGTGTHSTQTPLAAWPGPKALSSIVSSLMLASHLQNNIYPLLQAKYHYNCKTIYIILEWEWEFLHGFTSQEIVVLSLIFKSWYISVSQINTMRSLLVHPKDKKAKCEVVGDTECPECDGDSKNTRQKNQRILLILSCHQAISEHKQNRTSVFYEGCKNTRS